MPEPLQPNAAGVSNAAVEDAAAPNKPEGGTATAPGGAQQATKNEQPWALGNGPIVLYFVFMVEAILGLSLLVAKGMHRAAKEFSKIAAALSENSQSGSSGPVNETVGHRINAATQQEAEKLLAGVAAGDRAAAQQVLEESDGWLGKTQRTARSDQLITAGLNQSDLNVRAAAVQAQLALEGIPRSEGGVAMLEQAVGNPNQRAWALWMLGALGSRGVDPAHTAKIVESYLGDPQVQIRASVVDALSLEGTDETIPMLLDRFRNDPSPLVQERAACDLAQSGLYTHAQRMAAARSFVGWVDDALLSAQQRAWTVQALSDISGKNFGANSSAWKAWYGREAGSKSSTPQE